MKNLTKVSVLVALLLVVVFPLFTFASEFNFGNQAGLSSGEKSLENFYVAGGSVISAGSAEKDLLIAGGTSLVSGPVAGDLFVVGGNVTVMSPVGGDARIGGGNIIINGDIAGDAVVAGGQIIFSSKSVGGDMAIAAGTLRMDSEVKGNIKIAGGEVYINGIVGGDADIRADKLTLGPKADIMGNLSYKAQSPMTTEQGGQVRGETSFTEFKGKGKTEKGEVFGFLAFMFVARFFMILAASLLIGLLFGLYSRRLVENAAANPLKEFGRGVAAMILIPIFSVFLLFTVVGIPLGVIGLLSFAILMIYSCIITPVFLGALVYKWISRKPEYVVSWKTILLGVVVHSVLGIIPLIGWLAVFVAVMITLGSTLKIKTQVMKEWR